MANIKYISKPERLSGRQAWRKGADLALELLENAANALDEMALDDDRRDGRPQHNIMLNYLRRIRVLNDPRIDAAFCAVLTDYIAGGESGGTPDVNFLRKLSQRPIATAVHA